MYLCSFVRKKFDGNKFTLDGHVQT